MIGNMIFNGYKVLIGNKIGDADYVESSIAEPDSTRVLPNGQAEIEFVMGATYTVDSRVIRPTTHRVYRDSVGGVASKYPENDPTRWVDEGPTNRWAWNDTQVSTKTTFTSPYSLTVNPGGVTHIGLAGMADVALIQVKMWDEPGGNLIHDRTYTNEDAQGQDLHWSLYFSPPVYNYIKIIDDIQMYPGCQIEITLSGYLGKVGIGMISFGTVESVGEAEVGAEMSIRDYGYTNTDKWGNSIKVPGQKGADIKVSGKVPVAKANQLRQLLTRLLDSGAIHIPSDKPQYEWLITWGILKPATMRSDDAFFVSLDFEVEGFI